MRYAEQFLYKYPHQRVIGQLERGAKKRKTVKVAGSWDFIEQCSEIATLLGDTPNLAQDFISLWSRTGHSRPVPWLVTVRCHMVGAGNAVALDADSLGTELCSHRTWTMARLKAPSPSGPLWRFSCRLNLLFCTTAISSISALLCMPVLGKIPGLLQSGFCAKLKHLKACNTLYYIFL